MSGNPAQSRNLGPLPQSREPGEQGPQDGSQGTEPPQLTQAFFWRRPGHFSGASSQEFTELSGVLPHRGPILDRVLVGPTSKQRN